MSNKEKIKKKEATQKKVKKAKSEKYFYGLGRRKTALAQVRIYINKEPEFLVNQRKMEEYFPTIAYQNVFQDSLKVAGFLDKVKVEAKVKGGGLTGQVEAIRLAIARALVNYDEGLKKVLRAEGFLTRDARRVERKKPGLKKARRAPQWAKR